MNLSGFERAALIVSGFAGDQVAADGMQGEHFDTAVSADLLVLPDGEGGGAGVEAQSCEQSETEAPAEELTFLVRVVIVKCDQI